MTLEQPHSWRACKQHLALLACTNPASLRSINRELAALNSVTSAELPLSHLQQLAPGGEGAGWQEADISVILGFFVPV